MATRRFSSKVAWTSTTTKLPILTPTLTSRTLTAPMERPCLLSPLADAAPVGPADSVDPADRVAIAVPVDGGGVAEADGVPAAQVVRRAAEEIAKLLDETDDGIEMTSPA